MKQLLGRRSPLLTGAVVIGAGALLLGMLTGCGNQKSDAVQISQADIDAAVQQDTTLNLWGWGDGPQKLADAFTAKYPKVKINFLKLDGPGPTITKIQNAIKAGSGAPDIVASEYQSLTQLALQGALADLSGLGFNDKYANTFTPSTWNSVHVGGKLVGIPEDSGPMVMIYNKEVYDKAGIATAPTTWDQFATAAAAIRSQGAYIANTGDAGFMTSQIWAAGGKPFQVNGTNVTINLADTGSAAFIDHWNGLLDKGYLSPATTWSDEWSKAVANDQIATLMMGSWMVGGMKDYDPGDRGKWRVAPIPTKDGIPASAENGGSALALVSQSQHKAAAAGFLEFIAEGDGRAVLNAGGFPSDNATLQSETLLSQTFSFYAGQAANTVAADAAKSVVPGWQYLPYQAYANEVFNDSVGKALSNKSDLAAAFKQWQQTLAEYGKTQGFQITG